VNVLRPGTWQPGGVSPALLAVQLVATFQAALRGLDYLRHPAAPPPGVLAVVESAAPPAVWGGLLCGSAVTVLLGLAGRWPAVLILGHALLAAVYVGVGAPVLASSAVGPLTTGVLAVAGAALGTWTLVSTRAPGGLPARLLAVVLMTGAVISLAQVLGFDYRTGTGLIGGGAIHASLAVGVIVGTLRRRAAELVEV
jgi:hypothetical protein